MSALLFVHTECHNKSGKLIQQFCHSYIIIIIYYNQTRFQWNQQGMHRNLEKNRHLEKKIRGQKSSPIDNSVHPFPLPRLLTVSLTEDDRIFLLARTNYQGNYSTVGSGVSSSHEINHHFAGIELVYLRAQVVHSVLSPISGHELEISA